MENAEFGPQLGCVVMAAGNARRFGSNKLTASLNGQTLIRRALEAVPSEQFFRVVVVTQYPEIMNLVKDFSFTSIFNAHPDRGISYTVQLGLTALRDCDAVLFLASDQPLLRRDTMEHLTELYRLNPDRIVALGHNGVRGNPCIFPACLFPELMRLTEDHGGNTVIRAHENLLLLCEAPADQLTDIDTPAELEELKKLD